MKKLGSIIYRLDKLNDIQLLRIGATLTQLHAHYDHLVHQDNARYYQDFNFNRKARKLAIVYKRDVKAVVKRKGKNWLQKHKDSQPKAINTEFDGIDFIILDEEF
jgi:hypothetical protein